MIDRNRLTRQQLTCLQVAARGSLHRWPRGQWANRPHSEGVVYISFASITIHVLVSRGLLEWSEKVDGVLTEVRITAAGREALARHHKGERT